jgi:O-antigen/teichoic acid export membrane protein
VTDDHFMLETVDQADLTPSTPRGFRAPGTSMLLAGTAFGAGAAYLFQAFGNRSLGEAAFAPIAQLWTVFFILVTVALLPLAQYVTREASRGRRVLRDDLRVIAVTALSASTVGGLVAIVFLDALFAGDPVFIAFLFLLPIGYATLTVGKGVLAGHRRFGLMGWVLFWEGAVRLLAAFVLIAIATSARSLALAMVLAPFAALGTRFWRFDSETAVVSTTRASGFLGAYMAGSSASQLLLAGAPLAIALLGGPPELVSTVFLTFTLFRGPLTLIYSLQGRILPFLVKIAEEGGGFRSITGRIVVAGLGLAALGGGVGWLIGPEVVELLFDASPDRLVAALAAAGVVAASTTQVSGQVLVALGGTGRLATSWVAGLLAALVVLPLVGLSPDRSVAVAFVSGELVALTVAAWMSIRSS